MTGDNETIIWSFDFSEALEFDPALADLMRRVSPHTRIRLRYGDADAWLVTGFEAVKQVTTGPTIEQGGHRRPRKALIRLDARLHPPWNRAARVGVTP
ncbi:hypothetical protein [Streptomyces sp. NPDC056165]|uniref:hypothetical protein n=1 Tax=Streptomyces sp. NPDC056165 TaxID=3345733 RepID=UPI0035D91FDB